VLRCAQGTILGLWALPPGAARGTVTPVFGISFGELLLIGAVALMVVGPQKLPQMLGTLGRWAAKLRRITTEVRYQTGIDDLLRQEGLKGGLNELRSLVRPNIASLAVGAATRPSARPAAATRSTVAAPIGDPYVDVPHDRSREYPPEGCDAYGCIPDDLWRDPEPVVPLVLDTKPSDTERSDTNPSETALLASAESASAESASALPHSAAAPLAAAPHTADGPALKETALESASTLSQTAPSHP
jgi:sec-independent protein translocase protein TatB